jgi:hypothetical protein
VSRRVARAWGLELRFRPPSKPSHARTSFSQVSKLSESASCRTCHVSNLSQRKGCHLGEVLNKRTISEFRRLISAFSSSEPPNPLKSPMVSKDGRDQMRDRTVMKKDRVSATGWSSSELGLGVEMRRLEMVKQLMGGIMA